MGWLISAYRYASSYRGTRSPGAGPETTVANISDGSVQSGYVDIAAGRARSHNNSDSEAVNVVTQGWKNASKYLGF